MVGSGPVTDMHAFELKNATGLAAPARRRALIRLVVVALCGALASCGGKETRIREERLGTRLVEHLAKWLEQHRGGDQPAAGEL